MTETPILDEGAVEEIEARAASASPKYVVNWSKGEHALLQASGWRPINEEQPRTIATFDKDEGYLDLLFCAEARTDIPALCATVKYLREDAKSKKIELLQLSGRGELLAKEHVKFDELDEVAAVRNELDRLRNIVIVDLQSQLEQLRAENRLLKIATADPADKEYGPTVYDSKGNYSVLAQNAIDRNVSELRSCAIQLCKDKAAEWQLNSNDYGDRDGMSISLIGKAAAARELADEIGKL